MARKRTWLDYFFGPWILRLLGVDYPERPTLELIPGANVTITAVDDSATDATKVTIAATGGGGGGALPAGTANQVQTTVDGLTFHAPANVKAVDNAISVGASPSGIGIYRAPYGVGTVILGGKNSLNTDTKWVYIDSADCLTFGAPNGSGMAAFLEGDTAAGVEVDGLFAVYYDGVNHEIRNSFPRFGDSVAWGSSEGETTESRTGLNPGGGAWPLVNQGYSSFIFDGAATGSYAFDAPPDAKHTYFKFLEETGGFDKIITNNSVVPPTGTTYTLKANTRRWVKVTPNGVFEAGAASSGISALANVGTGAGTVWRNTTSGTANLKTIKAGANVTITNNADDVTIAASGGSPAGSTGQIQTNNAGAFAAPGPYAGASYVSLISGTPTNSGLRLGNTHRLSARNSGNSADRDLCYLDASDVCLVGDLVGNTSVRAAGTLTLAVNGGATTAILTSATFAVTVPIAVGTNPAATGGVRIANGTSNGVNGRNATNSADIALVSVDSANNAIIGAASGAPVYVLAGTGGIHLMISGAEKLGTYSTGLQLVGTAASHGGGSGVIGISNAATDPTTNPTAGAIMYASSGAIKGRGSSGTVTTMAAAEPHCPKCGTDVGVSHSENDLFGEELIHCHACEIRTGNGVVVHVADFFDRRKKVA